MMVFKLCGEIILVIKIVYYYDLLILIPLNDGNKQENNFNGLLTTVKLI